MLNELQCVTAFHKVLYKHLHNRLQTPADEPCEHKAFFLTAQAELLLCCWEGAFLGFLGATMFNIVEFKIIDNSSR